MSAAASSGWIWRTPSSASVTRQQANVAAAQDAGRYAWLVDQRWRLYRFTKYEVYGEPDEILARIGRALMHVL